MENQTNSKSIILKYGLIYGGIVILANLIIYALGMTYETTGGIINLLAIAFAIIALPIIGIAKFKRDNNGNLTWGEGLKIGVGIVFIGAIISILYTKIFTGIIEPDFYMKVEEMTKTKLLDAGMSEEQIDTQLTMQAKFQGTIIGDALGLLFYTFLGFVVSAIVSSVKKKTEEY
ncbi:DUF4199 domain-containing protein [Tenacibaculum sp. TC6]|uniref:DUF4199 domain-containing protein n=1 Tax=Tenacibaculum sp. TC6 TaxID=3423223 RepID=UPI003D36522A